MWSSSLLSIMHCPSIHMHTVFSLFQTQRKAKQSFKHRDGFAALCDSLYSDLKAVLYKMRRLRLDKPKVSLNSEVLSFCWVCRWHTIYHFKTNGMFHFASTFALIPIQLTFNNSLPATRSGDPVGMCWPMPLWQPPSLPLQSNTSAVFSWIWNTLLWPILLFLLPPSSLLNKSSSPIPPLKKRIDFKH